MEHKANFDRSKGACYFLRGEEGSNHPPYQSLISLLKKSLLCVKFYIYKIDLISVFVVKLKTILTSAKGVSLGRVSYDNHSQNSLDTFRI